MDKNNLHINFADLERFLYNLRNKDLYNLRAGLSARIEEVYESLCRTTEQLPVASNDTIGSIYVDESENCYITINSGTKEEPEYKWVPIGIQQDSMVEMSREEVEDLLTNNN